MKELQGHRQLHQPYHAEPDGQDQGYQVACAPEANQGIRGKGKGQECSDRVNAGAEGRVGGKAKRMHT